MSAYEWPLDRVLVDEFDVEPAEASVVAERILGEHARHVADVEGVSRTVTLGCGSVLGLAFVAWLALVFGGLWIGGIAGYTAALVGIAVPLWAWLLLRLQRWRARRRTRVLD